MTIKNKGKIIQQKRNFCVEIKPKSIKLLDFTCDFWYKLVLELFQAVSGWFPKLTLSTGKNYDILHCPLSFIDYFWFRDGVQNSDLVPKSDRGGGRACLSFQTRIGRCQRGSANPVQQQSGDLHKNIFSGCYAAEALI